MTSKSNQGQKFGTIRTIRLLIHTSITLLKTEALLIWSGQSRVAQSLQRSERPSRSRRPLPFTATEISWAVQGLNTRIPGRFKNNCLRQALAGRRLLTLSGHECDLFIGIDPEKSSAHAWIELSQQIIIGKKGDHDQLTVLNRF